MMFMSVNSRGAFNCDDVFIGVKIVYLFSNLL